MNAHKLVAVGGFFGVIDLLDADTFEPLGSLPNAAGQVYDIQFSRSDNSKLLVAAEHHAKIWDVYSFEEVLCVSNSVATMKFVNAAFTSAEDKFVTRSARTVTYANLNPYLGDGEIAVWDVFSQVRLLVIPSTGDYKTKYSFGVVSKVIDGSVSDVLLTNSLRRSKSHLIAELSLTSLALQGEWRGHSHEKENITAITICPETAQIASAGESNAILLWDAASGLVRQRLSSHVDNSGRRYSVLRVIFSPDGTKLASLSQNQSLTLWDVSSIHTTDTAVSNGTMLWTVNVRPNARQGTVSSNLFSFVPDGLHVACCLVLADYEFVLKLFDVATGAVSKRHSIQGEIGCFSNPTISVLM
jgi:WD40 repeat protein